MTWSWSGVDIIKRKITNMEEVGRKDLEDDFGNGNK